MSVDYAFVRKSLDSLSQKIATDTLPTSEEWGGADVVITSDRPAPEPGGFYPEPRYVVTPDSRQLSWLFYELKEAFSGLIDYASKIEFYGRLANAAIRYQDRHSGDENQRELIFAVLHEAFAILDEMEEGSFQYFLVAPGGMIADDVIERAEKRGFIGIDETRRFFVERGVEL